MRDGIACGLAAASGAEVVDTGEGEVLAFGVAI